MSKNGFRMAGSDLHVFEPPDISVGIHGTSTGLSKQDFTLKLRSPGR